MSVARRSLLRRVTGVLGGFRKRQLYRRGLRESLATEQWSADQISAHFDRELPQLVQYAYANVPFYRQLYDEAGVDVVAIRCAADIVHLPTISKADLLAAGREMEKPGVPEITVARYTTGGSTGTIGTLAGPRGIADWETGCIHALWQRIGFRDGDPIVTLRGALIDDGRRLSEFERATNRLTISTYHLNDDNVDEIIRLIDDFQPKWLHVYASAATLLANVLRRTEKRLQAWPAGVLCGSEAVFDWHIALFSEVYGCRTYSHYGHGELALLGGWCERVNTYHFLPNHGYLELLDDDGQPVTRPDTPGEITGTGFYNRVMPLIRFRTADWGAWDVPGPCPACHRAHQRLSRIEGRIQEYLILQDGTRFPVTNINALHGLFFSLIYRFQFVQHGPGRATLRFMPAVPMNDERLAEIRAAFAYLGPMGLALDFACVDELPLTASGKQRVVLQAEGAAG
jgi:phenylacetate-CoA ligase